MQRFFVDQVNSIYAMLSAWNMTERRSLYIHLALVSSAVAHMAVVHAAMVHSVNGQLLSKVLLE